MANINTNSLHGAFVRKFAIGTNSATRFTASFLSAYNDTLLDLYNDGHILEPTIITQLNVNTTVVEERYLPQIRIGIQHFLQSEGEWVKGESRDAYSQLNWEKAKTVWQEIDTRSNTASTYPWSS